jgi:hypothetical protein
VGYDELGPAFEKEDFPRFGASIFGGQAFQAALAHPSREARREEGGSDQEGHGGGDDLEIVYQGASSRRSQGDGC